MRWYFEVFRKYAVFSGRARRREYWMFVLFNVMVSFVLNLIDAVAGLSDGGPGPFGGLYLLAVIVPSIAVLVRRLHDTDHGGLWILMLFVPLIGALVILFFLIREGTSGPNEFGPDPKAVEPS